MTARAVYWGHWLRLSLAALVGFVALTLVSLVEFGFVTLMAWGLLSLLAEAPGDEPGQFVAMVVLPWVAFVVLALVLYLLWAAGVALGWLSDAPATRTDFRRFVGLFVVAPLALTAAVRLLGRAGLSPIWPAAATGVAVVSVHQYRLWSRFRRVDTADELIAEDDPKQENGPGRPALREELQSRVDRLAGLADVPPPTVRLVDTDNRVATVGSRQADATLCLSPSLVDELADEELDAVLAHELAHLANRDATVLTLLSLPVVKIGQLNTHGYPLALLPVVLLCELLAASVARHREVLADRAAARLTGDPAALASALDSLADTDTTPATDLRDRAQVTAFDIVPPSAELSVRSDDIEWLRRAYWRIRRRLFGTHPPTRRRIEHLRELR